MNISLCYKRLYLALSIALVALIGGGCCRCSSRQPATTDRKTFERRQERIEDERLSEPTTANQHHGSSKRLSQRELDHIRLTKELYERLERSHQLLQNSNPEAALRELERLQLGIRNDPYLEMQSWYLSAMIYHKTGAISRRRRSMRKMMEALEKLQKDPRFLRTHELGIANQQLIETLKNSKGHSYENLQ